MVRGGRRGARGQAPEDLLGTSTPRAIVFSAFTTIASFGNLALSPHPGTASMGALLTIGVSLAMLATLLVVPALVAGSRAREARIAMLD
jgi:predicted RND superfamily exporter protein